MTQRKGNKILILSSEFPPGPGGIGTHAYYLSEYLVKSGWNVLVCSPQNYVSEEKIIFFNKKLNAKIVRMKRFKIGFLNFLNKLFITFKTIIRFRPSIIIATGEKSVWIISFLNLFCRVPWISIGHGSEFLSKGIRSWITKWSFNRACAVISVSKFTKNLMIKMGIFPDKIRVIYNGIDEEEFKDCYSLSNIWTDEFRKKLGLNNKFLLLTVGSVTDRKGQELVIRALPYILKENRDVHYLIVGLPILKEKLESIAEKLHVKDHIHFLGVLDRGELKKAYSACDVFVMTSRKTKGGDVEGFGIAILEAAICGKPSIVKGGSGLSEAVLNGVTGLVIDSDDPKEIAKAVIKLSRDKNFRIELGVKAFKRVVSEFTWDKIIAQYNEVIRNLL